MNAPNTLVDEARPAPDLPRAQESHASSVAGWWHRAQRLLPTLIALALLLGMLIYAEVAYGRVFHPGTMSDLLGGAAPMLILAVGMTLVIISAGIDLSVGAVVAFSSVAGVMLMGQGLNGWLGVLAMIVLASLFGLFAGVMVQYFNVQPFIATLAMMFLARGLASMLTTDVVRAPRARRSSGCRRGGSCTTGPRSTTSRSLQGCLSRSSSCSAPSSSCTAPGWGARCTASGGRRIRPS